MKLSFKSIALISAIFIIGLFLLFSMVKSSQESMKKKFDGESIYKLE